MVNWPSLKFPPINLWSLPWRQKVEREKDQREIDNERKPLSAYQMKKQQNNDILSLLKRWDKLADKMNLCTHGKALHEETKRLLK